MQIGSGPVVEDELELPVGSVVDMLVPPVESVIVTTPVDSVVVPLEPIVADAELLPLPVSVALPLPVPVSVAVALAVELAVVVMVIAVEALSVAESVDPPPPLQAKAVTTRKVLESASFDVVIDRS